MSEWETVYMLGYMAFLCIFAWILFRKKKED